ncbi:MAG: hypothetical protein LBH46_04305, partial [Rickettsiales bacterium]|nr:hypothetical protein [Rickettsiales bacterium]
MEKINYRYRTVKVILSTFKDRKDIWYNNHISYIINGNYYEITVSNLVIFPEELGMAIHRNLYNTIDVMEINQNIFEIDSRKY